MVRAERVPENEILLEEISVEACPTRDALVRCRLVRVLPRRIPFVTSIGGNPQLMVQDPSARAYCGVWLLHGEHGFAGYEFV